jgi:RimJ/RimL family protein N-acetyltransferase
MSAAIPTLETARLVLRGWREGDFAPLAEFYASDEGARYVGGPLDAASTWRALAARVGHWHLRGFGIFAVDEKATGRWLGWCGLWRPHEFPEIELAYALIASARGKGFVTEAAACVRDHAFAGMGLSTLVSYIAPDNAPSQAVARRLGGRRDGTFRFVHRELTADVWRYQGPGGAP